MPGLHAKCPDHPRPGEHWITPPGAWQIVLPVHARAAVLNSRQHQILAWAMQQLQKRAFQGRTGFKYTSADTDDEHLVNELLGLTDAVMGRKVQYSPEVYYKTIQQIQSDPIVLPQDPLRTEVDAILRGATTCHQNPVAQNYLMREIDEIVAILHK